MVTKIGCKPGHTWTGVFFYKKPSYRVGQRVEYITKIVLVICRRLWKLPLQNINLRTKKEALLQQRIIPCKNPGCALPLVSRRAGGFLHKRWLRYGHLLVHLASRNSYESLITGLVNGRNVLVRDVLKTGDRWWSSIPYDHPASVTTPS